MRTFPSMAAPSLAALLLAVALAACQPKTTALPAPHEPGPNDVGVICHMSLAEHIGPKGQVFLKGRENDPGQPLWFSSVRDTFVWLLTDEGMAQTASAVWVNDMGRARDWDHPEAGTWVEAHRAVFVVGSDRNASMGGGEFVPFSDRAAAGAFIAAHGGRMIEFKDIKQVLQEQEEPRHEPHS